MNFSISDDQHKNEQTAIEYLESEIADRDTVINFLLMKIHNSRSAHLRLMRENIRLKKELGDLPSCTEFLHLNAKQSLTEFERKSSKIKANLNRGLREADRGD